jgi:hypothetical protein
MVFDSSPSLLSIPFSLLSSGFGHSEPRIGGRNSLCSRNSTPPVSVFGWRRSLSRSLSGSSFLPSDHNGISNPHPPQNWGRHSSSSSSSSTFLSPPSSSSTFLSPPSSSSTFLALPGNLFDVVSFPYFVLPATIPRSSPTHLVAPCQVEGNSTFPHCEPASWLTLFLRGEGFETKSSGYPPLFSSLSSLRLWHDL